MSDKKQNNRRISILDCTLRDGGFAIEDGAKYVQNIKQFSQSERDALGNILSQTGIEYIELGGLEISSSDKKGYGIYQSIEDVSQAMPRSLGDTTKYVALFRGPDTPIDEIPQWNNSLCRYLRLIVRYSELKKSIDFCAMLASRGYKVFIQPMVTARYTMDEIQYIIAAANDMKAHALYFVDSYGYMTNEDVRHFFDVYNQKLEPSVKIGFHAHNNINLAFSNVRELIRCSGEREIIADSTILGMGQGAGNLQTELLADYLNKEYSKSYDYGAVLDACEIIETHLPDYLWGYAMPYTLGAINKTAYKFAADLRKNHKMRYRSIHTLLESIPEELRHRYSNDNIQILLGIAREKGLI